MSYIQTQSDLYFIFCFQCQKNFTAILLYNHFKYYNCMFRVSQRSEMAKIIEAKFGLCVIAKFQFVNEE